jgi:hypothetical protein
VRKAVLGLFRLLALASCSDGTPPRPSDAELGAEIWKGHRIGAVRPYDECLKREAETTSPLTDLGLKRLAAVRAACATEERALIAAFERTWSDETREELDGRIHGIQIMALEHKGDALCAAYRCYAGLNRRDPGTASAESGNAVAVAFSFLFATTAGLSTPRRSARQQGPRGAS